MLLRRGELEREEKLGGPRDAALDNAGAARNEACGLLGRGSQKDSPLPGVSAGAFLADSPEGARWVPPQGASVSPRGMWHGEAGPQSSRWGRRGEICFVQSTTSVCRVRTKGLSC